jgi:putative colanic acid biosysnthesis UDP-glucose lipid carrier transferase
MVYEAPRSAEPLLVTFARVCDALVGAIVFAAITISTGPDRTALISSALIIFSTILIVFTYTGVYRTWQVASFGWTVRKVLSGIAIVLGILVTLSFFAGTPLVVSRGHFLMWFMLWTSYILITKLASRSYLFNQRIKGRFKRTAVICGVGESTRRLIEWVDRNPWSDTIIVGIFHDNTYIDAFYGVPILGTMDSAAQYIDEHGINMCYLTLTVDSTDTVNTLMNELYDTTTAVYVLSDYFIHDFINTVRVSYCGSLPVLSILESPHQGVGGLVKRLEDIVFSILIILLVSPLLIMAAAGIFLTMGTPILFKQWRYGLDGCPILVWKFRTMTVNEDGYKFRQVTRGDARVTKFGQFLRKTSIDEMPQFFNVLQGRMSIVGPRPHAISMVDEYRRHVDGAMLRHIIKPGITGPAQIYGTRGVIDSIKLTEERIGHDHSYIDNWSFFLDVKIIFLTAVSLFHKEVL